MNNSYINKIKNLRGNPSVTICMNTHRTFPDNSRDSITLKNLISEACSRIENEYGKDDSVKLPVKVKDNIMVGDKFAVKVLLRSILQTENYYILCLSRKVIRLIEAVNEYVVSEINDGAFPLINDSYLEQDDIRKSWSNIHDRYAGEFFKKGERLFRNYYVKKSLPVILAGDGRNISYYRKASGNREITGILEGNYDDVKANEIAQSSYAVLSSRKNDEENKTLSELESAAKEHRLLLDINDIYRALKEGNCLMLIAEKNYYQPCVIENNTVLLKDDPAEPGVLDDIVSEFINMALDSNCRIIFCGPGRINDINRIALITRY